MVAQKSHVDENPSIQENLWVRNYFEIYFEKKFINMYRP